MRPLILIKLTVLGEAVCFKTTLMSANAAQWLIDHMAGKVITLLGEVGAIKNFFLMGEEEHFFFLLGSQQNVAVGGVSA